MTTKIKGTEYTLFIDEWDIARMIDNNTNKVVSAWEADENTVEWFKENHCKTEEETTTTETTTEAQNTIPNLTINIDKEEKTMKNTREYRYEIRQLDAWRNAEDGYDINESWHMGEMTTKAENINKAFTAWMKRHLGITFKNNRTLIEYDGDCYTIIDRKTKEPLFIAIPNC